MCLPNTSLIKILSTFSTVKDSLWILLVQCKVPYYVDSIVCLPNTSLIKILSTVQGSLLYGSSYIVEKQQFLFLSGYAIQYCDVIFEFEYILHL